MRRTLALWFVWLAFACSLATANDLDLNTATAEALTSVPGIGPARAEAIVAWRAQHGPFSRFEDVAKVPGCGPATVRALKEHAQLRTTTTTAPSPQHASTPTSRAININRASTAVLQQLPGIGPTKASLIVAHREARGPFSSCEALASVPGFTRATVVAVGDHCTTEDPR